jgi:FtsP/CotA-like multicopper oxidase with cupredoxin domain
MRDRYFLLNGRGYPDTVNPDVLSTVDPTGKLQPSQPVSSLIAANAPQRILLRISNLSVTDFYTVGTNGIPMQVVGLDARLLRDGDGNNMYYKTNSLTLGGGQSADVILDTNGITPGTYFLYAKNLDKLANDAENFGGMMTEIRIN